MWLAALFCDMNQVHLALLAHFSQSQIHSHTASWDRQTGKRNNVHQFPEHLLVSPSSSFFQCQLWESVNGHIFDKTDSLC